MKYEKKKNDYVSKLNKEILEKIKKKMKREMNKRVKKIGDSFNNLVYLGGRELEGEELKEYMKSVREVTEIVLKTYTEGINKKS